MMRQRQETTQPKMTNGSSAVFSIPDDDFAELVWENGQVVMQSQASRNRKSSFPSSFSSRYGAVHEKDTRENVNPKFARLSETDPGADDFLPSRPPANNGVNGHDDDMVPWIGYPIEEVLASETLQNDYCAEFLNEFSAFDTNPLSAHKNAIAAGRTAGFGLEVKNSGNVEHGRASKVPMGSSESGRTRTTQLFQLSQQCQSSVPVPKLTMIDIGGSGSNVAQEAHCGDMADNRSLQNQQQCMGIISKQLQQPSLMNFSHFARPAALAKINLRNTGGLRSIEKASALSSSNPIASTTPVESANGMHKLDPGSAMKAPQEGGSVEQSNAICVEDALGKNNKPDNCTKLPDDVPSSSFAASVALCRHDTGKDPDAAVASSTRCSGNVTGEASNEPNHGEKRKEFGADQESDSHSDYLQDESVGIRKPPSGRVARTKRSRAAEVHNLSERRRRNRINEKMRALQELVPNCNKVDKASMLEEAIEYLKTLQLQVQMMSMGSGLYMLPPPMMLPPAMQHLRALLATAHFPPVGVGMEAGIGIAPPGCPMLSIPPMHAPQFPCIPSSAQLSLNPQMFGVQGQGIPVLMPRPPSPPFSTMPVVVPGAMTSPAPADAATMIPGDHHQQQQQQQQQNLNAESRTSADEALI